MIKERKQEGKKDRTLRQNGKKREELNKPSKYSGWKNRKQKKRKKQNKQRKKPKMEKKSKIQREKTRCQDAKKKQNT